MNFGEKVCMLFFKCDRHEADCIASYMLINKITINLNMHCSFMKNIVVNNLNNTPIITTNSYWKMLRDSYVLE